MSQRVEIHRARRDPPGRRSNPVATSPAPCNGCGARYWSTPSARGWPSTTASPPTWDRCAPPSPADDGDTVVVSEEVGLGVHPSTAAGRLFHDALGEVNVAVATIADKALLVLAGRVLPLGLA